jgi:hypothetical protein
MGPVIDTAKQKVWTIVSEIAKAKPTPVLRIGLIGYGNGSGPFRMFALTDDLDKAYENLVTFRDEGWSDEWVGLAIQKAAHEMQWKTAKEALRIIFVVGNETARQGKPDYADSIPEALKKDITVNMIYCGNQGGAETWQEAAKLGDGAFTTIAQTGGAIVIETPMDKPMVELNAKLNGTYLPFGARGAAGQQNQVTQDANSGRNGGMANEAQRAQAKAWSGYNCRDWDLVDASKEKEFKLDAIKGEDLPKEMQAMSVEERRAHIDKMRAEREALQKQIQELGVKRQKFVDDEIARRKLNPDSSFDEAVRRLIRAQGGKRGYRFE